MNTFWLWAIPILVVDVLTGQFPRGILGYAAGVSMVLWANRR